MASRNRVTCQTSGTRQVHHEFLGTQLSNSNSHRNVLIVDSMKTVCDHDSSKGIRAFSGQKTACKHPEKGGVRRRQFSQSGKSTCFSGVGKYSVAADRVLVETVMGRRYRPLYDPEIAGGTHSEQQFPVWKSLASSACRATKCAELN